MAESKSTKIEEGAATAAPLVQSTTKSVTDEASSTPMPNVVKTDPESPPLSTARPDVPIAQVLAAGAGEHTPPDPKKFDPDGRPKD